MFTRAAVFLTLRRLGYFVEVLSRDFTCFDASHYGTLLLFDLEDEFHHEEVTKLHDDVAKRGLSLVVWGDWCVAPGGWGSAARRESSAAAPSARRRTSRCAYATLSCRRYNAALVRQLHFFDDNTKDWWDAATGGANLPAMNDLLRPFGLAFGDRVLSGVVHLEGDRIDYRSRSHVFRAPKGARVLHAQLNDEVRVELRACVVARYALPGQLHRPPLAQTRTALLAKAPGRRSDPVADAVVLALVPEEGPSSGRVSVWGDSNCMDQTQSRKLCVNLFQQIMLFAAEGTVSEALQTSTRPLISRLNVRFGKMPEVRSWVAWHLCAKERSSPAFCTHRNAATHRSPGDASQRLPNAPLQPLSSTIGRVMGECADVLRAPPTTNAIVTPEGERIVRS